MKKLLSILLAIILIISVTPLGTFTMTVGAATSGTTGDCTWSLDGMVLTISGSGAMGNYAYSTSAPWGTNITKVYIEYGVTSIGEYAFYNCGLLKNAEISNTATSIGDFAFSNCKLLKSVIIPDGVSSIGWCAFSNCRSLESITVGKGIKSIYGDAFTGCDSLTDVYISDLSVWCNVDFITDLYPTENNPLTLAENLYVNGELVTELIIPEDVIAIKSDVFAKSARGMSWGGIRGDTITSVVIPDSVVSIGDYAFHNRDSIANITLGNGVTSIGHSAFASCFSLTNITMSDYVSSIGEYAFNNCDALINIKIPDSVTNINNGTFSGCNNLKSIVMSKNIISIGEDAFNNCNNLTDIWYTGNKNDKENIAIYYGNTVLEEANWHYNTCKNNEHRYKDDYDSTCENCEWTRLVLKIGDVNGDGTVNNKDLGILMQHLNDWDVEINVNAADVNADGKINNKDYGILMQYLNDWDVELQ